MSPDHALRDPDVAALEGVDVALVVVRADERRLRLELVGRFLPVGRCGEVAGSTPIGQKTGRTELHEVTEHPDLAAERGVEQVLDRRDLAPRQLGVVADRRQAGLPGHRVLVPRVPLGVGHQRAGVGLEVRHLPLVEGDRPSVGVDDLVEHRGVGGEDDDVVTGRLVRLQDRRNLRVEAGLVVDRVFVGDMNPGVLRELVQGRVCAVRDVDVVRPVREDDLFGGRLLVPPLGRADVGVHLCILRPGHPAGSEDRAEGKSAGPDARRCGAGHAGTSGAR